MHPSMKREVYRGYGFASEMDKLKITEAVYKECCEMYYDRREALAKFGSSNLKAIVKERFTLEMTD